MPSENSKPVKKEVAGEEEESAVGKKKPINAGAGSRSKEARVKKEDLEDADFEKPTPKKNLSKTEKVSTFIPLLFSYSCSSLFSCSVGCPRKWRKIKIKKKKSDSNDQND